MEKVENIIKMENFHFKVNFYMDIKKKEKNIILMVNQNMKANIYLIENGMEKAKMKEVI